MLSGLGFKTEYKPKNKQKKRDLGTYLGKGWHFGNYIQNGVVFIPESPFSDAT